MGPGRFVVVLAMGLGACSSEESGIERYCEGLCSALTRCGYWDSAGACESNCVEESTLDDVSDSGAAEWGECLRHAECGPLLEDATFEACWDDAKLRLNPTSTAAAFCEDYARTGFQCGFDETFERCQRDFGMWSDGVLDRLRRCSGEAECDRYYGCITAVFESL